MDTAEEAPAMIDGYPNFEWSPGNPITDGYKNEDDDKYEYEHIKGTKEEISLQDELDTHDPLDEKYEIQEMGEYKYHREEPKIISEESDEKVEEEEEMTIEDDTY